MSVVMSSVGQYEKKEDAQHSATTARRASVRQHVWMEREEDHMDDKSGAGAVCE